MKELCTVYRVLCFFSYTIVASIMRISVHPSSSNILTFIPKELNDNNQSQTWRKRRGEAQREEGE